VGRRQEVRGARRELADLEHAAAEVHTQAGEPGGAGLVERVGAATPAVGGGDGGDVADDARHAGYGARRGGGLRRTVLAERGELARAAGDLVRVADDV